MVRSNSATNSYLVPPCQVLHACCSSVQICHGRACKNDGRHRTAPYLSADCKEFVQDALLKGIPKRTILEQSKQRVVERYMVEHNLPTLAAAEAALQVRTLKCSGL